MIQLGITDDLESPRDRASGDVYAETIAQTELADALGFDYAWFTEHHAHAHHGHLPSPLLLALHLAERTKRIRLGTAVICLNLHHPLDVAEQVAVADVLSGGRMAAGFGSGSTPEEFALFGQPETDEGERHARFAEALEVIISAWRGEVRETPRRFFRVPLHRPLPVAGDDLVSRSWLAVNSVGAAKIAGAFGFNALFSHLRTPAQYRDYAAAYRAAGGAGKIAANRPVYVGEDDATAWREIEPALRTLWRRFRAEGKIPATTPEPADARGLGGHPINFVVGDSEGVATQLAELHRECPYDVLNLEPRWAGLSNEQVHGSLRRIAGAVRGTLAGIG